jgi:hypothetical protein
MQALIMWAIGIVVLVILAASVLMPQIKNANTTGWSTGEIAMWGLGGIVLVAVVIISIAKAAGGK